MTVHLARQTLAIVTARKPSQGSSDTGQSWSRSEAIVGTLLFLFCLLVGLTQFVNPFPHDHWFASQYRIFRRLPGADNYTPIAVPAYLYAAVHGVALLFRQGLAAEFYLGSLLHHLLLFLSGVFLYLSHRCLSLRKSGLLASVLLVVFVESTLTPQAFWSENVTLCLMSAVLFVALAILTTPHLSDRSFLGLSVIFGLLLGGLTITRLIPFVILPGLILLYWFHLPRDRVIRFALLGTGLVLVVVLATMSANVYRYGRFELSNSVGRHLWNVVSLRSEEMLGESREYQLLKAAIPDVQGKYWWEIKPNNIQGLENFTQEQLLRTLAIGGIFRHPLTFGAIGIENTLAVLGDCPDRMGLSRAEHYNPLKRDTMLPTLLGPLPALEHFLAAFHRVSTQIYGYVVYVTLVLGFSAVVAGAVLLTSSRERNGALVRELSLFLLLAFFTMLYLTYQIERPAARYGLPLLPLLALMGSTTIGMVIELMPKRVGKAGGNYADQQIEKVI